MPRINALFLITKLELGGAQKQLLDLIRHLDKEKFRPFLFTAQGGLLLEDALSIDGLTLRESIFLERPINPLKDLLALIEIYFFIRKNNIEIVHTHSSKAGVVGRLAARLCRVKFVIHTVHGWSFNDYQPRLLKKLFIALERFAGKFTDKLIVVSCHDKQKGLRNRIGQEDKYFLIRYGIDYTEFSKQRQDIRDGLGIGQADLVVTNISCLKPQKSPLDFIKLANLINKKLPEVKFLLIGDGLLRKKIEKSILRYNLGKNVILPGWRRDIPEILSATDVLVLTSLWEGLPISVLEAMASSRPVVATHTGGVAEVIDDGKNGFLVPPRDINKMSERLMELLSNGNKRRQMGQFARDSLNGDFSIQNMINNTEELYENLWH